MKPRKWLSETIWLIIGLTALAWELVGVFTENRTGIEPLTRIVRDGLFQGHFGQLWVVAFIAFWGWLAWHWLVVRRRP